MFKLWSAKRPYVFQRQLIVKYQYSTVLWEAVWGRIVIVGEYYFIFISFFVKVSKIIRKENQYRDIYRIWIQTSSDKKIPCQFFRNGASKNGGYQTIVLLYHFSIDSICSFHCLWIFEYYTFWKFMLAI